MFRRSARTSADPRPGAGAVPSAIAALTAALLAVPASAYADEVQTLALSN